VSFCLAASRLGVRSALLKENPTTIKKAHQSDGLCCLYQNAWFSFILLFFFLKEK
jgi:hypothetical protein